VRGRYNISKADLYANTTELIWEDENKEVIIKGKLYDVIALQVNGDQIVLSLLPDFKEQDIKANYAKIFTNNSNNDNTSSLFKLLKQLISLKFTIQSFELPILLSDSTNSFFQYSYLTCEGFSTKSLLPPIF
jgi:hypothetical protein